MSESTPVLTLDGPLAVITLNRPTHRHRLHAADLVVLKDHLSRIDADPAIRVAVLQSDATAANGVFCAGYHIGEHGAEADDATFAQIVDMLEDLRPPTLCALSGDVYGGATDLVLACDFTIAVDTVRMRMPAAALGLHYYPSGIVRYVSRLGVLQAKRAFLTATHFEADELLAIGYVQALTQADRLAEEITALAARIVQLAPMAVQHLKRSINEVARGDYDPARLLARQRDTQASRDFTEGQAAFFERRPPHFTGH